MSRRCTTRIELPELSSTKVIDPGAAWIDLDYLAAQTCGDTALMNEILELFIGQAKALVDGIRLGPDPTANLHRLLGSARAVGAGQLARSIEAVDEELRLRGGARLGGTEAARQLEAAVQATCGFAASVLSGNAAIASPNETKLDKHRPPRDKSLDRHGICRSTG